MSKQIWKNISSGWMQILLSLIFTIMITPLVINTLGREMYGLWILIFNIVGYLYLADFGITNSISRIYSKYNILNNKEKLGSLIYTIYIIIFLIDIFIILFSYIFYEQIMSFLEVSENLESTFLILFIIAISEVVMQMILRVNIGILQGIHKFHITNNLNSLNIIVKFILIYILVYSNNLNVFTYTMITSGTKLLINTYSFYIIREELRLMRRVLDKNISKEMAGLGSSSLIISFGIALYTNVPTLLFGKMFSLENVILYSIPLSLMLIVSKFINTIFVIAVPKVSELKALKSDNKIYMISSLGIHVSLLINFLSLVFFIFFAKDILILWLGENQLREDDFFVMYNILILLMGYLMLMNIQKINNIIYKSIGLHWVAVKEITFSVLLLFILVFLFYQDLKEYIFAVSMLGVGVFKFLFYKYSSKDKSYISSHSILTIIFHFIALFSFYSYINFLNPLIYVRILFFCVIFTLYSAFYFRFFIKPLFKALRL